MQQRTSRTHSTNNAFSWDLVADYIGSSLNKGKKTKKLVLKANCTADDLDELVLLINKKAKQKVMALFYWLFAFKFMVLIIVFIAEGINTEPWML